MRNIPQVLPIKWEMGFYEEATNREYRNKYNACWVPLLDIFTRYNWYYGLLT